MLSNQSLVLCLEKLGALLAFGQLTVGHQQLQWLEQCKYGCVF